MEFLGCWRELMIKIAICDDNTIDMGIIENIIINHMKKKDVQYSLDKYGDGEDLIKASEETGIKYDLIFMDIFMMNSNGMDIAKVIKKYSNNTQVVFSTSSTEHAIEAYDIEAIGYLLKPIEVEKCIRILDRFLNEYAKRDKVAIFKSKGKLIKTEYDNIIYLDSRNTTVIVHLVKNEVIKIYGKLDDVEAELSDRRFLRTHKSYLINMNHIKSVDDNFVTDTDEEVIIRTRGSSGIKNEYYEYIKSTMEDRE